LKIYIASRFSRRHECHDLAKFLIGQGHEITSRWVKPDSDHVKPVGMSEQAADDERNRFAVEDIEDVEACDCMVSLMEQPRGNGRGGRHVEFGYALALRKHMVIIGPKETVFHHLEGIEVHETIEQFKAHVVAEGRIPNVTFG